jgi:hypothetical protein
LEFVNADVPLKEKTPAQLLEDKKKHDKAFGSSSRAWWKIFPKRTATKAATATSPALWFREVFSLGLAPRRVDGQVVRTLKS